MPEFEVGDHTYRTKRMSARAQLQLLRVIGPLFGPMVQYAAAGDVEGDDTTRRGLRFTGSFFQAFSQMENRDVDLLINQVLAGVQRRVGGNGQAIWTDMWNANASSEQFDDYSLTELVGIAWHVLQENLGPFLSTGLGLIGTLGGADQPQTPSLASNGSASTTVRTS